MYLNVCVKALTIITFLSASNGSLAYDRLSTSTLAQNLAISNFKEIIVEDINPQRPPLFRGIIDELIDSTVAVIGNDANFGSGVLLESSEAERLGLIDRFGSGYFVATVNHVVSTDQEYAVIFYNQDDDELDENEIELATVLGKDPSKDLAFLKINRKPDFAKGSKLARTKNPAAIGDDVQAIGHPNEMWWTYTRGYISQFRKSYEWFYDDNSKTMQADVIQTQTPISPGNSGGPLFSKTGDVLGLNAFGDPEFQSINFAIAANEIETFAVYLSKLDVKSKPLSIGNLLIPEISSRSILSEYDLNDDGRIDAIGYDTNGDGIMDLSEIDANFDGITDHFEYDLYNDNTFSLFYFPSTSEFYAEWIIDTTGDGAPDYRAFDKNGDGSPDMLDPA